MDNKAADGKGPRIVCVEAPGDAAAEVAARLADHVAAEFGPRDEKPLSVFAYDEAGALIAGLNGATHWRWLYVRNLWTAPELRGRGLAGRVLGEAELKARERGCIGVYIDTFDPAAGAFYEKRGFARFGTNPDFPPGAQRIFLAKRLG